MFPIYKTEKELRELDKKEIKYSIHKESKIIMNCNNTCDCDCENCEVTKFNNEKIYQISYPTVLT